MRGVLLGPSPNWYTSHGCSAGISGAGGPGSSDSAVVAYCAGRRVVVGVTEGAEGASPIFRIHQVLSGGSGGQGLGRTTACALCGGHVNDREEGKAEVAAEGGGHDDGDGDETGSAVYNVIKLSFCKLVVLPSPAPALLNAVTTTSNGELVLSVYV